MASEGHGFGIVGCGVIAATHAEAVAAIPGARLVAVTDVAAERAAAFAREHGCVAEPGLGALLARADVDVVCVCVPSGLHAEVGVQAAEAGKHLAVEKPIDVSLAAADRLIAAADAAGVTMTVISQHRFGPGPSGLRRMLDAQALGQLVLGEASTVWHRTQSYYDSAAWRGMWALDGGSLLNQGIHYVDLLRWCMGPVAEVSAACATLAHQMEAEDTTVAVLRFCSGALGTIVTSTAAFPGSAQRLEITGTAGTVVVEDGQITHQALTGASGPGQVGGWERTAGAAADPAAVGASGHTAQLADLLVAIEQGCEPSVTARDGLAVLELACAIYQSARENRPVPVRAATSGEQAVPR